jgi:hypothetical protein
MTTESQLRLCYLDAGKVQSPVGHLSGLTLQSDCDEALGTLEGVVIDPAERRIRYFVVRRTGWLRSRRFLLPADRPAQIIDEPRTLRLKIAPDELAGYEDFDTQSMRAFSDEDVVTAMFASQGTAGAADAA